MIQPDAGAHWFALRVRSQCEMRVRDALTALEIENYLPSYEETVRWSDRFKVAVRCLFPGYVFARFAPLVGLPPLASAGLVAVLGGMTPTPIDDAEIDNVRRVVALSLPLVPCAYVVGALVTVDSGPLAGVSGVVVRVKGETRLVVRIELLRRAVSVEMDAAYLKAAA